VSRVGEIKGFLSYSAKKTDGTNLPSWLHFNPLNRTFSGDGGNRHDCRARNRARPVGQDRHRRLQHHHQLTGR